MSKNVIIYATFQISDNNLIVINSCDKKTLNIINLLKDKNIHLVNKDPFNYEIKYYKIDYNKKIEEINHEDLLDEYDIGYVFADVIPEYENHLTKKADNWIIDEIKSCFYIVKGLKNYIFNSNSKDYILKEGLPSELHNHGYDFIRFLNHTNGINRTYKINKQILDNVLNNSEPTEFESNRKNFLSNYNIFRIYDDHAFAKIKKIKKTILSINAIHWLESPKYWNLAFERLIEFLNNYVDVITTSNDAMKSYLEAMLKNYKIENVKIIVNQIGYKPNSIKITREESRNKLIKCKNDDIVFINSGGIWGWTDFNTFLEAFVICVNEHKCKFKLIIPGMKQANNFDELNINYQKVTNNLLDKNKHLLDNGIIIKHKWSTEETVDNYLIGSDIGINVSKYGIESLLSERVRISDYKNVNIKILNTFGDEFSIERLKHEEFPLNVISQDLNSYVSLLLKINENKKYLNINKQWYSNFEWSKCLESLIYEFN
jgi:hypothetical protein